MSKDGVKEAPIKEFRFGGIKLAIWRKDSTSEAGKPVKTYSIKVSKSYKDKSGQWKETDYFYQDDLTVLSELSSTAFRFILVDQQS